MSDGIRVKIVSDGTGRGTRIVSAATGEPVVGVLGFSIEHRASEAVVKVKLTMLADLELTAFHRSETSVAEEPPVAPGYHGS